MKLPRAKSIFQPYRSIIYATELIGKEEFLVQISLKEFQYSNELIYSRVIYYGLERV